MVRSENNINAILEALEDGRFYSSCGPEIYNFYVEDDVAVVECSEVVKVWFQCDMHPTRPETAGGALMTGARWKLNNDYKYIRVTVIDKDGNYAWTNPIFL